MEVSLILAHPNPQSFNHAIAHTILNYLENKGHKVFFHDLYQERFNPLLFHQEFEREAPLPPEIQVHCREIARAEGIVIIHPNWWGQPPAVLKGWVDRVIRPGIAYEFLAGDSGEGIPRGLLRASAALVFNTSNTEKERELTIFGDPLETIWRNCIFGLCGISNFYRRTFCTVVTSTEEQRKQWLDETIAAVATRLEGKTWGA